MSLKRNRFTKSTGILVLSMLALSGCGGPTPEEQAMREKMMNRFMASMNKKPTHIQTKEIKQENIISEEELAQKINAYPKIASGVKFTKLKDGFKINDKDIFIDPEGSIVNYGFNWKNGDVTYMIQTSPSQYKLKYTRVLSNMEPTTIANVTKNGSMQSIMTVTGKRLSTKGMILTSKGFATVRKNSAFIYEPGKALNTFTTPKGWHIAQFQNGDLASTKHILLEKTVDPDTKSNSFLDFIESTKELGNSLGINDKEDYMLVSIENSEKTFPINITIGSKNVGQYSDCEQSNSLVRKCNNVDFTESLYTNEGLPNTGHYYWAILWFTTGDGEAILATRENTQRSVIITDLTTGTKKEAAYRVTGFPELMAEQDSHGHIKVIAGGGIFPDEVIEDAEAFIKKPTDSTVSKETHI